MDTKKELQSILGKFIEVKEITQDKNKIVKITVYHDTLSLDRILRVKELLKTENIALEDVSTLEKDYCICEGECGCYSIARAFTLTARL